MASFLEVGPPPFSSEDRHLFPCGAGRGEFGSPGRTEARTLAAVRTTPGGCLSAPVNAEKCGPSAAAFKFGSRLISLNSKVPLHGSEMVSIRLPARSVVKDKMAAERSESAGAGCVPASHPVESAHFFNF